MSVIPARSRISNTGMPKAMNAERWYIGCSGTLVSPNGMSEGACVWTTAITSGRIL